MKTSISAALTGITLLGTGLGARAAAPTGEYVEARTASVFAGACHYGGEYVSDGREAVSAWHFTGGDWHGVSLAGLSAVAVVRADANLVDTGANRSTMVYVDAKANPAQRQALAEALAARCAKTLGAITSVTPTAMTFTHSKDGFRVQAPGVAALSVDALPDAACCKQPGLVWYAPLTPLTDRRVGFTKLASCTAKTGGDAWSRGNENSAFYGTFTL